MTQRVDKPQLGDVISSPFFAHAFLPNPEATILRADTNVVDVRMMKYSVSGSYVEENLARVDQSRGHAKFVVEEAILTGGSSSHLRPGDDYPHGWRVTARRLNDDGSYNPQGEQIQFYSSYWFTDYVPEVTLWGKMQRIFVAVE